MKLLMPYMHRLVCVLILAISGCASAWKNHYRGAEPGVFAPTESVTIREIPWSRLDETLRSIESARAASDIHPDEWTDAQRAAEHAALLRGLQVSEDPGSVVVIGRSVFRSTDHLRPEDGSLERFARSIGADLAVWSANHLGTRRVTRQQPVHEHGYTTRRITTPDGRKRTEHIPWDRTFYVPVAVDADEYAWVVYYLRRSP